MKKVISVLFVLMIVFCFAQDEITDLEKRLESAAGTEKVELLNSIAKLYWDKDPNKSIDYGNQALELAIKDAHKLKAINNIGTGTAILGEFDKALEYFNEGLKLAEKAKNKEMISAFSNNIANILYLRGDYQAALKYYLIAMEYFRELGNEHGLCSTHGNIALIYDYLSEYDRSLKNHELALEYAKKINNKREIAACYLNIAEHHNSLNELEEAEEYYIKAKRLGESLDSVMILSSSLNGLAQIFRTNGNYAEALKNYSISLKKSQEIGDITTVVSSLFGIGQTYIEMGEYRQALKKISKSYDLAKKIGMQIEIIKNVKVLANIYEEIGNYSQACYYLNIYCTKKDSIHNIESKAIVSEMKMKFENQENLHQLEILRQKTRIQKLTRTFLIIGILFLIIFIILIVIRYRVKRKANLELIQANNEILRREKELEQINAEKNKFFSIISHDLKNAFNTIRTGAKLLSVDIDRFDKKTICDLAEELRVSADNLYRLLENLLQWSRIQMSRIKRNPVEIDLKKNVDKVIEIMQKTADEKEISISNLIQENVLVKADQNMFESIVQNLLSNSIKFTNRSGKIEIDSEEKEEFYEISVKDNGIGIKAKNIDKLFRIDDQFSLRGTDNEKGTGLGLILCREFARKNNGDIRIKSTHGAGTTVIVTLPKSN